MDLRNHVAPLHDEMAHNLYYGLQDYWYARRLLRAASAEGRERFSEHGWAYGDPSYGYGTDPFEVFRHQAGVVAATLFGGGVACDLHYFSTDDQTLYDFLRGLRDGEDLRAFPDPEEEFPEEFGYGDAALLVAEICGEPETIWRLKGALRRRDTRFLYYDPEGEYGRGHDRSTHLVLMYDMELYPERETVHHELFDALIRAKEAMHGDDDR